jgi:hypothetical protein
MVIGIIAYRRRDTVDIPATKRDPHGCVDTFVPRR